MIDREEIESASARMGVHPANVERDYVFGWLLKSFYENDFLASRLIFKGGNCMRKAFYPETRFSRDLDFSLEAALDLDRTQAEINRACETAQAECGVQFDINRNSLKADTFLDSTRRSYKGSIYFKDFYGNSANVTISVRVDLTEFDRIHLVPVIRPLIHDYSDAQICRVNLRCMQLEELLANKLKCLLQRRHSFDLYDLVYATFFERSVEVNRRLVLTTFLKKTIFETSPLAAKDILLGLPMPFFKGAWDRFVAPLGGRFSFDRAEEGFRATIEAIFDGIGSRGRGPLPFYPPDLRNLILEAGAGQKLLALEYDGGERFVEPYSLAYKRRKDGHAAEYFYVWDRTGGTSGPGIKSLLHEKVRNLRITDEVFEPRYPIELAKAGEPSQKGYFGRGFSRNRTRIFHSRTSFSALIYTIECPYCHRRFSRSKIDLKLKQHKDINGYSCAGRIGYVV